MNNDKGVTLLQLATVALVAGFVAGLVVIAFAPKGLEKTTLVAAAASPAGSTFVTAKIAAISMAPISNSATSTSVLNTDSSDRIVTDAFVTCAGVTTVYGSGPQSTGVDAWHWYAATSSVAAPTTSVANASLAAMNVTVATSSSEGYTATTTYTSVYSRRWNSGSYMVFQTNATSSAAACTTGVHYIAT